LWSLQRSSPQRMPKPERCLTSAFIPYLCALSLVVESSHHMKSTRCRNYTPKIITNMRKSWNSS
jgi:hypothetical protein